MRNDCTGELVNADQFIAQAAMQEFERREQLERTLEIPMLALSDQPPTRQELVDFIRAICEGSPVVSSNKVQGQRAIELAAWDFYRRLQEAHEL